MTVRDIAAVALFAAFIVALGYAPPVFVPFFPAVPLSLHSLSPMLAGALLGAKRGFAAVALFWLLLLGGLAVAGGMTGPAVFLSPMGGYIIGFGLAAALIGALYDRFPAPNIAQEIGFLTVGSVVALLGAGIVWLVISTKMSLAHALWLNMIFLPGDCAKIALCIAVRRKLKQIAPAAFR